MMNVKLVNIPMGTLFKLQSVVSELSFEEYEFMKKISYSNVNRRLMYVMTWKRLNIEHTISLVSRFMSKPSKEH